MIVSVAILTGFKKQITDKVIGFGSHIQVKSLDMNESFEGTPVNRYQKVIPALKQWPGVKNVQVFAHKAGIIKTATEVEGIVLKGVGRDYNWTYMQSALMDGKLPDYSDSLAGNDIYISKLKADKLRLKVGDNVPVYFIQEPVRARNFKISGIFETGLEDYDKSFAIVDLRHIQRLNNWNDSLVQGFEVLLDDLKLMEPVTERLNGELPVDMKAYSAREMKPQIFDWLGLLDTNVVIIIVLMVLVACINMVTALLVLIIERTNMIGILKALGSSDGGIQRIFIIKAAYLIGQGMLLGNILGIGFCLWQGKTRLITLDPESYYLSFVPVNLELLPILLINAGAFLVCIVAMFLPALMVLRISPVKAIRFD